MQDFDISPSGPLCIGIELEGEVWITPSGGDAVRVRAVDLRGVGQRSTVARTDHPHAAVVVDIDVVIARDARSARAMLAATGSVQGDTLLYVGTPSGLAGLIADIHALGIADGAVLIPVVTDPVSRHVVTELIHREVLPQLGTMGPMPSATRQARPA
jgi:alkanesulfonate monooxygenase SsuD/methylene tetrahydromethanopterin reductase-like flavin-dependent oxidoreductase (luciferase family)